MTFLNIKDRIKNAENKYQSGIKNVVETICKKEQVRLILIAGPSCSGKTTTSALLSKYLSETSGKTCHTISIDDFYKDVVYLPGETVEDKDFEALDSIDLELLRKCLHDLSVGKTVDIPLFDFEKTYRNGIRSTITLGQNDIAIIEGLHALNPEIYEGFVDKEKIVKIFLDCQDEDGSNKNERFIRRLVRDRNFRNADAILTFTLWKKVLTGEEKYIYPFEKYADFTINTYHDYETSLLRPYARKLLCDIQQDSVFYDKARFVLDYLDDSDEIIDTKLVPKDSLLREFIG